jgi:hypothetical protein
MGSRGRPAKHAPSRARHLRRWGPTRAPGGSGHITGPAGRSNGRRKERVKSPARFGGRPGGATTAPDAFVEAPWRVATQAIPTASPSQLGCGRAGARRPRPDTSRLQRGVPARSPTPQQPPKQMTHIRDELNRLRGRAAEPPLLRLGHGIVASDGRRPAEVRGGAFLPTWRDRYRDSSPRSPRESPRDPKVERAPPSKRSRAAGDRTRAAELLGTPPPRSAGARSPTPPSPRPRL